MYNVSLMLSHKDLHAKPNTDSLASFIRIFFVSESFSYCKYEATSNFLRVYRKVGTKALCL